MSESFECYEKAVAIIKNQLDEMETKCQLCCIAQSNKEANAYFKKGTRKLAEFFYSKGYLIVDLETGVGSHYQLAKQIYASLPVSWDFNSALLRHKESEFSYEISNLDNLARSSLLNLCEEMKKKGFIDYTISETSLEIKSYLNGENRCYLSGECYEEANRYLIEKTIQEFSKSLPVPLSISVYRNIRLKKADSTNNRVNDMQLDFVVEFSDRFYVFETKAGTKLYIDKWVDRTRLFNGDKDRFISCCLQDFNPKTFEPFLLLPMKNIEEDFRALLEKEFLSKQTEKKLTKDEILFAAMELNPSEKLGLAQQLEQIARKDLEQITCQFQSQTAIATSSSEKKKETLEITPASTTATELSLDDIIARLKKLKCKKEKTLLNSITTLYKPRGGITEENAKKLIKKMIARKVFSINENGNVIWNS